MRKLIYFSPVHWSSYKQRPHFVVENFLQQGYEVIWIEPYPVRLSRLADFLRSHSIHQQGTPLLPGVSLLKLSALPIEPLPGVNQLNVFFLRDTLKKLQNHLQYGAILGIGKPCQIALKLLQTHQGTSFYDAMDDFPEFHRGLSRWHMKHIEKKIAQIVSHLIVSSTYLANKFAPLNRSLLKILNAADFSVLPAPTLRKSFPPILGYIGTLGAWFDWEIIQSLANKFPQLRIRLIGPCFMKPSNVPNNIEILPPCPHSEVGKHLVQFSIGLIPFQLNSLTIGVDPIKFYEYAAMGLPIISTNFGEMHYHQKAPGVFIIHPQNLEEMVHKALNYQPSESYTLGFRETNSWDARLNDFVVTIEAATHE